MESTIFRSTLLGLLTLLMAGCVNQQSPLDPQGSAELSHDRQLMHRTWEQVYVQSDFGFLPSFSDRVLLPASGVETSLSDEVNVETLCEIVDFLDSKLVGVVPPEGFYFRAMADITLTVNRESGRISVDQIVLQRYDQMPKDILFPYAAAEAILQTDHPDLDPTQILLRTAKSRKYVIECEGGEKDGERIVVERTISGAKKAFKFTDECIDGGGCTKTCKANLTLVL